MAATLAGLNEAQRAAVASPASVLQVLAPPGSGKTKTLTARVAHLIAHEGLAPRNIIVCTFTVKAAREMKERIRSLVGNGVESQLVLGTFHSVARRFLVAYGHLIGLPKNFGIADSQDSLAILKRIIKRRPGALEPSAARSRISSLKAKGIACDQHASSKSVEKQEFALIYSDYEENLKLSNLLDYDDILLRCVELLRHQPGCVSHVEAVLIDEFQDTNNVQYELMCLFAQHRNSITIVGDPDQSIYGFRSAEIKNLKRMQRQFADTMVIVLEENYRSSGSILLSALEVIEQDESRPAKKLLPTHCTGERPVLRRIPSAHAEAEWIVTEIQRCMLLTGNMFIRSDFAILLRSASLSRHIESAFGKAGIPYRMVGGLKFFDRAEIKVVLDYLRVINLPDHSNALLRVLNVPSRKIGDVTIKNLVHEAENRKMTLWNVVLQIAQGSRRPDTKLSTQAETGLKAFVNVILTSRAKLLQPTESPFSLGEFIHGLLKRLRFQDFLKKAYPSEEFETRWSNVEELVAQASDPSMISEGPSLGIEQDLSEDGGTERNDSTTREDALARFLANILLSTDIERNSETEPVTEQVTISTIHAAKGLEWPVVFIPAAFEGSIPHSRAEDTDEERRLLYVGMTRAQSLLYVSCPTKNSQGEQTKMSHFLPEKSIYKWFSKQGPSFTFCTVQDLARILRRPCPSQADIFKTSEPLEAKEDDFWPLDGERPDNGSSRRTWEDRDSSVTVHDPYKRRRVESRELITGAAAQTTMHRQDQYSMATTTLPVSFVSASTQLRQFGAVEPLKRKHDQTEVKSRSNSRPGVDNDETALKRSSKQRDGQGSITNFFVRSAQEGVDSECSTARTTVTTSQHVEVRSSTEPKQPRKPLQPVRNASLKNVESIATIIPPLLAEHKLCAARTAAQRFRPSDGSEEENKTYGFLSSSPVREYNEAHATVDGSLVRTQSGQDGARTVSVLYASSTTIQSLPHKKSLGMRRSVQGWTAATNKPFQAPGRTR